MDSIRFVERDVVDCKSILTENFLRKEYIDAERTIYEISDQVGCSPVTVWKYLKRYDLANPTRNSKPKYLVNQNYFDTWSHEMAYVLGITLTDGCLAKNHNKFKLQYTHKKEDKELINFIQSQISPNRSTHEYNGQKKVHISGLSWNMIRRLNDLGVVPRKTYKVILPDCPQEYRGSLLRGIFDGDGWISCCNKKRNYWKFGICSASQRFLGQIKENLCFGFGNITKRKSCNCYDLSIYTNKKICKIANLMYKHDCFSLQRKKQRFVDNNLLTNNDKILIGEY